MIVNPEITWRSKESVINEEGCLSLPEIYEDVERPQSIAVRYQNLEGETVEERLEGYPAIVFQHEADHLNGVLFIDHISVAKRRLLHRTLLDIQRKAIPRMAADFVEPRPASSESNPKAKETL